MKLDRTTGLPELPEDHFWRVKEDEHYGVILSIRKRRKRMWSKSIIARRVFNWAEGGTGVKVHGLSDENFTPDAIRTTAQYLLVEWRERDAKYLRYHENKKLAGDYPPLTLEGK